MIVIVKIAIFYAVGAVIVGSPVASMETFCATWRGKPIRYSRLVGGVVAGILWPSTLLQFLTRAETRP
jgi:hypothetical protein